jgi:hypothetical protein
MSTFAKLFDRYKTYDEQHGRGNVQEWRRAFDTRMNLDEAKQIVRDNDPLIILDLVELPSLAVLKNIYRKLMLENHPDRGGDPVKCKKIIAAFTILEKKVK